MTPNKIKKKNKKKKQNAKQTILVGKDLRRIKTFSILAIKYPITTLKIFVIS